MNVGISEEQIDLAEARSFNFLNFHLIFFLTSICLIKVVEHLSQTTERNCISVSNMQQIQKYLTEHLTRP